MDEFDITSDIENGELDTAPVRVNPADQSTNAQGDATVRTPKDAVRPEEAPQPKADDTRKSLREQIAEAVKADPAQGVADQAAQEGAGRPRNPDGTFAPAPAPEGAQQAPSAPVAPVPLPAGLAPAEVEIFSKLPAEMQQYVARTMENVNTQAARYGQLEEVHQVLAPRMQNFALQGFTPGQVINQLFALSDFAEKDPAGFVRYFSEQRGIDLEEIVFGGDEPGNGPSPEYVALEQKFNELQSKLQQQEQTQAQVRQQETANRIVAFFDAKDETGNALRPYANEVGGVLTGFIQMVRQQQPDLSLDDTLQKAYDAACWASPEIRAKLQERTDAAQQAQQLRDAQERAKRKQDASSSMAPTVPNTPRKPDEGKHGGNLRDTIRAAIASQ